MDSLTFASLYHVRNSLGERYTTVHTSMELIELNASPLNLVAKCWEQVINLSHYQQQAAAAQPA